MEQEPIPESFPKEISSEIKEKEILEKELKREGIEKLSEVEKEDYKSISERLKELAKKPMAKVGIGLMLFMLNLGFRGDLALAKEKGVGELSKKERL